MAEIVLESVNKVFADGTEAVHDLDLVIPDGQFVVLVGPSGCGKTTVLRMVAGLEDATSGNIGIGGKLVNDVPPGERDVAMVFQNYALYPHMTVYQNIALSLRIRKFKKAEMKRRVDEAARVLHLEGVMDKRPRELSGGQRQRVAMGRGAGARAAGLPDGRTAVEPRCQAPCTDARARSFASSGSSASRRSTSLTTRSRR